MFWRRPGQGAADTEQAQHSQALPIPCSPGDKCYSSALQAEIRIFLLPSATHFQAAKQLPLAEKMRLILFLLPNSPWEFFCQEAPGAKQWELVRRCRPSMGWPRTELAAGPAQGCHCPTATEATELLELGAGTRTLAGVLGRAGEKENVCN